MPLVSPCVRSGPIALVTAASLLSGCAMFSEHEHEDDRLAGSVRTCMTDNAHFVDGWGCVQARYARGEISAADARVPPLMTLGNGLAEQVDGKKLSDAKAKAQLSAGLPPLGG